MIILKSLLLVAIGVGLSIQLTAETASHSLLVHGKLTFSDTETITIIHENGSETKESKLAVGTISEVIYSDEKRPRGTDRYHEIKILCLNKSYETRLRKRTPIVGEYSLVYEPLTKTYLLDPLTPHSPVQIADFKSRIVSESLEPEPYKEPKQAWKKPANWESSPPGVDVNNGQ